MALYMALEAATEQICTFQIEDWMKTKNTIMKVLLFYPIASKGVLAPILKTTY
jgi:hypothetical protein